MEFDKLYQQELLMKLSDPEFMGEAFPLLEPAMWDVQWEPLIKQVLSDYRKTKRVYRTGQLRQLFRKHGLKLPDVQGDGVDVDVQNVLQWKKHCIMREEIAKLHQAHEDGNYEGGLKKFQDALERRMPGRKSTAPDLFTDDIPMQRRTGLVPVGLPTLDEILGGGVGRGDLAMVLGSSSSGKSAWLVHVGAAAVLSGINVYHVTLEISRQEVAGRYRSRFCDTPNPSTKQWKALVKKRRKWGKLHIQEYPPGMVSVEELNQEMPLDVGLLIVDYLDDLKTPGGRLPAGYEDYGELATEHKRIAMQRQIPVWTASQVNRGGYSKSTTGLDDVDSSLKKITRANQVITLNQQGTKLLADNEGFFGTLVYVAKNTFGPRFKKVELKVDWSRNLFME